MALNLERKASTDGVKISTNKTKIVSPMGDCILRICINRQGIENVDEFLYLGCVMCADECRPTH